MSFKRLRLEREQIRQILLDLKRLTSDTSFKLENMFLKRAERDLARRPSYVIDAASLIYGSKICNVINTHTDLFHILYEEQNQFSF